MKQQSRLKLLVILIITLVSLLQPLWAADSNQHLSLLPADAQIWQNRSGIEGSGYSEMPGPDIAFYNNAWSYWDDSERWVVFHQGATLNFNEVDSQYTEALQYEVFSGTPFSSDGTPGQYNLVLDGATGDLITEEGSQFDPHNFESLIAADNKHYYYHIKNRTWWHSYHYGVNSTQPPAPYKPNFLNAGTIPAPSLFGSSPQNQLIFDIETLRYRHISSNVIAAFHPEISADYQRWNNRSNEQGSGYSGYPQPDIAYVDGEWYQIEDETHYAPFFQGRYLDFATAGNITEALALEVMRGTEFENEGTADSLGLKLDGVTGQLLYNSEGTDPNPELVITLNKPLVLFGLSPTNSSIRSSAKKQFSAKKVEFKLLRVVPLRNRQNDPFNERTLTSVIKNAQRPNGSIPNTFNSSNLPSGGSASPVSCALNINLNVLTGLPDAQPLGNTININTNAPFNLQLGLGAFNSALNINIINQINQTQANITLGAGFTLLSGSLGIKSEGSTLTYAVRRNSDSTEFKLNFSFQVERVFDDNGISIQSLSGQLCQQGGLA